MNKQPLCLHCNHCFLLGGEPDYSEITPGEPMSWKCTKGHFDLDESDLSNETVANAIYKAETCPDFEMSKLGIKLGVHHPRKTDRH